METRETSEHAQSAPRNATGNARNAAGPVRPPHPQIGSPASAAAPTAASAAMHRPRVRMRRAPAMSARYEMPSGYDLEDTAMSAPGDFPFDDDFRLDDELKMEFDRSLRAPRRAQRIKYVKCRTRVLPDLLVPYLYAGSRINAIMERTGCSIDYCPESPDEDLDVIQPQRIGSHYLMCFLVAAETTGQLEAGTRLLHILVDRVQAHVELKLAAGATRLSSDAESQGRQESRGELPSPRFPSHVRHERGFSPVIAADSPLPHTDFPVRADALNVPQGREGLWVNEHGSAGTQTWHEPAQSQSSSARTRHTSTRFRRPVYRRILVDEAGYEVYEHPQYEHPQRFSPMLSGHASSPPLRRRRTHEPIYHRTSSSEDEEIHVQRSAALPSRSSRVTSHRVDPVRDGLGRAIVHNVSEQSGRRGMKRQLELYGEDIYLRRRAQMGVSNPYDHGSEDRGSDYTLSGDELLNNEVDGAKYRHQLRYRHQRTIANEDSNEAPINTSDKVKHLEGQVDSHQNLPGHNQPIDEHQVANTSETSEDIAERVVESSAACTDKTPLVLSAGVTETNGAMSTTVSVMFDDSMDNAGRLASDTESVAEVSIAPSTMASAVHHLECSTGKTTDVRVDDVHESEPTRIVTSTTGDTISAHVQQRSPRLESKEKSEAGAECEHVASSPGIHAQLSEEQPERTISKLSVYSARVALNEVMKDRFTTKSLTDITADQARSTLVEIAQRLAVLIERARSHDQLKELAHAAHRVERELSLVQSIPLEDKRALFATLDAAVRIAADPAKTVVQRVLGLQRGLDDVVSSSLLLLEQNCTAKGFECEIQGPKVLLEGDNRPRSDDPLSADLDVVNQQYGSGDSINLEVVKLHEENVNAKLTEPRIVPKLNIPTETPTFVSGLVTELERTTGLTTVMASAQKRLLREISKSDPYYYLHPVVLLESARKGRGSTCPFGCAGASAHKWERKVVSQISSRMKWFDSVAYSLAKVSGGKELLSRKKMNSTIRKLHLVALQLHCLIAHLFCVRKRVVCREVDSLPTALNNSYYEKRMNGYKSRLKLTLHQQPPPMSSGISLPTEELVRDTFEFYPELLLSIDIWGYDYRHETSLAPTLPMDLLRSAAYKSFDFESDSNGLLQGVCEELLGILCLWNDFKWGESLESLSTEDIVEFESKVKTSIRKILEAHSSHLLSQWSVQLASSPAILNHIRLTQSNVYYSEQPATFGSGSSSSFVAHNDLMLRQHEEDDDDYHEDGKDDEDMMLQDFWRTRFTPSTAPSDADTSEAAKSDDSIPILNLSPLREDFLMNAALQTKERVLSWSEVYDLRQQCHQLTGRTDVFVFDNSNANEDPQSPESVNADVTHLLNHLAQARSIVEDAIRTSEKLVLHSVHHQLDESDRNRHFDGAVGAGTLADVECMSEESRDEEDIVVDALLAGQNDRDEGDRVEKSKDTESDDSVWKQPVLKDLVEIVTSTNQEMSEICGQRARSARVRDKLQSQSLELARQSIQIFQTILNMKP